MSDLQKSLRVSIADEYIDKLIYLFEEVRDTQFEIGDTLMYLVDSTQHSKSVIFNQLSGALGVSVNTLYSYENTARKWLPEFRIQYQHLEWTFYKETDPNDPEQKDALDKAIDDGLTSSEYMRVVYPRMNKPDVMLGQCVSILTKLVQEHWEKEKTISSEILKYVLDAVEKLEEAKYLVEE